MRCSPVLFSKLSLPHAFGHDNGEPMYAHLVLKSQKAILWREMDMEK